jgi:hypothetical protein
MGGELEYLDSGTLSQAFLARNLMESWWRLESWIALVPTLPRGECNPI